MIAAARGSRRTAACISARNGDRFAVPLYLARGSRGIINRRISRSICFRRSIRTRAIATNVRPRFANWRLRSWTSTWPISCLNLRQAIEDFLGDRRGATIPHTRCATTARICASSSTTFRLRAREPPALAGHRSPESARMAGAPLRPRAKARHHPAQTGFAAVTVSFPVARAPDRARSGAAASPAEDAEDAARRSEYRGHQRAGGRVFARGSGAPVSRARPAAARIALRMRPAHQ